jgi:hypothetical protein
LQFFAVNHLVRSEDRKSVVMYYPLNTTYMYYPTVSLTAMENGYDSDIRVNNSSSNANTDCNIIVNNSCQS